MMMRFLRYVMMGSVFFPSFAGADSSFTVDACITAALHNNAEVLKAGKGMEAARRRQQEALANLLPAASLGGQYVHLNEPPPAIDLSSLGRPGFSPPRISGNPLLQYANQDTYTAYVKLQQPVYTGGRNRSLLRTSAAECRIRSAEYAAARIRAKTDCIKAFYGVLLAGEMKKLSEEVTRQLQSHLAVVERLMRNGTATRYDYLRAESQLTSWQPRLARAGRDLNNALRRMKLLMGMATEESVSFEGDLSSETRGAAMTLEAAKKNALAARPEMAIAREAKEIAAGTKAVRTAAALPQVLAQYTYNFYDTAGYFTFDRDPWQTWWDVKVSASWEFFAFGRYRAGVAAAALEEEQRALDAGALEERIKIEVEDSFDQREESRAAVAAWRKNVEVAEQAYRIANENYKNGTMTNVDVLDSSVALADARAQYLKALYDHKVAGAEFDRIVGTGE